MNKGIRKQIIILYLPWQIWTLKDLILDLDYGNRKGRFIGLLACLIV